ncbi:hypothetical protein BDW66DRAFT_154466 [Aspergillus desertorum]
MKPDASPSNFLSSAGRPSLLGTFRMSVEQGLAALATGHPDNPHPSSIIPVTNGVSCEPNDSDDRMESESMLTPAVQAVSYTYILQEKLTAQTANSSSNRSRANSYEGNPKSVVQAPIGLGDSDLNVQQLSNDSIISRDKDSPSSGSPISVKVIPEKEKEGVAKTISPPPLTTSVEPVKDWSERATPRAQTRHDFDEIDRRPHSKNLEGEHIPEVGHFPEYSSVSEITALQAALVECWSLCNTLATLSSIHRERAGILVKNKDDAWKSCWRLCQQLYGQLNNDASQINPTLDLCRDFCQNLFEARTRDNEISDSVLRVSFELNNHLYNTHDRNLPDVFRERTLDFYITLCHRLMKQRTCVPETDSLLSACWSLAEMLFSIRQSKKEGRPLDEELLGSAVQACWELCDIFRDGWTQRGLQNSDRGTPRPSQATFAAAEAQHSNTVDIASMRREPETPTTIFEDVGTTFPEEGPVQNIFVLGQRQNIAPHANWSSTASSTSERSQGSRTSTNTVITLSNESKINGLKALIAKAALNNGFQRNGTQGLMSFVKSMSSDAFGSAPWQISLLKHYKALVAYEPAFQIIGPPIRASAMDIARAIRLMAQSGQYLWLYDLYRLVFGFHVEEGLNRDSIMLHT